MQGDLVDGDCLDHALHVPHTQSFSSFSLPCTASVADGTEVMDAVAHAVHPEVAQQSQGGCGQTDAQASDSSGVGDADNPSDHKVISLVQYAICSLLLHVVTPGVVYGLCNYRMDTDRLFCYTCEDTYNFLIIM